VIWTGEIAWATVSASKSATGARAGEEAAAEEATAAAVAVATEAGEEGARGVMAGPPLRVAGLGALLLRGEAGAVPLAVPRGAGPLLPGTVTGAVTASAVAARLLAPRAAAQADGAPLASPRRTGRAAVSGTKPPPSPPRAGTAPMWLLCGDRTVAAVAVPGDRGCGSCVAQVTEKESVHQILAGCTQKG